MLNLPAPEPDYYSDLVRRLGHFNNDERLKAIHEVDQDSIADPKVVSALQNCIDDDHFLIAIQAIHKVGNLDCRTLAPTVERSLENSWGKYSGFGRLGDHPLLGENKMEKGPLVRAAGLTALGKLKFYPALNAVLEVLDTDVELNRLLAVESLDKFGRRARAAIPKIFAYAAEWEDPGCPNGCKPFEFDSAWKTLLHHVPMVSSNEPVLASISALGNRGEFGGIGVDTPEVRSFFDRQIFYFGRQSDIAFNALHDYLVEAKDFPAMVDLFSRVLVEEHVLDDVERVVNDSKRESRKAGGNSFIIPIMNIMMAFTEYFNEVFVPVKERLGGADRRGLQTFMTRCEKRAKKGPLLQD